MSLSTAFNVISSSFAANAAQTAVVSNNIANVNTTGYSREIANVVTNSYGGADVASVTREANSALLEQVSSSTSLAATQQAISDGLTTLAATVGDSSSTSSTSGADQNGASPSAMLSDLQSALTTYQRLANLVVCRRRGRVGRLRSRVVAQEWQRDRPAGAGAGRPEHGLVGRHD